MNKRAVLLLLIPGIFLMFVLALALRPSPNVVGNLSCDLSSKESKTSNSDSIKISVHVDGSGSMLGYVESDSSSYVRTIELLQSTFSLAKSRKKTKVEFYRTGNGNQKLTPSDFRKARLAEFYSGSNSQFPAVTSALDAAITSPDEQDELFVLVSDMYQNDADVTRLNTKIQQTYLGREGYAVGLWAIRSEFNGTVYVSGSRDEQFTYNTQGQPYERLRPFYVMLIGPYEDIAYYFDKFKRDGKDLVQGSQFVIFSAEHLVQSPSSLNSSSNKEISREAQPYLKEVKSLKKNDVAVQSKNNPKVRFWEITRSSNEPLVMSQGAAFTPAEYTLPVDQDQIEENFQVENLDKKQSNTSLPTPSSLQLSKWQIAGNKLTFTTALTPREFPNPGIYHFTIDAVAKGLQRQPWWDEWTWDVTRDGKEDGSKTHNLSKFLGGLKTITEESMEKRQPVIGRFCYVIQKN